ncbi:MAG TPA: FAD-dependent oxidoreductase [bacterium]|nr:FAD-dependent oxidoreductase [bacterium]
MPKFIVIGGDAAGMSAASRAKRKQPGLDVEVFEKSSFVSYAGCGIPYFVSGVVHELEDLLAVRIEDFEKKRGIKVNLRHEVTRIVPDKKIVVVKNHETGRELTAPYDHLIISTGASPRTPPGIDDGLPGVFSVRGLAEAAELKKYLAINSPKRGLILGAGYIGLEMAEALAAVGMEITMVQLPDRAINSMEPEISDAVAKSLNEHGVKLITAATAEKIERDNKGKLTLSLSNNEKFTADLMVIGIGVTPNSGLAADAGLELGARNSIKVDRRQRTSAPDVYSAGDCAEHYHRLLGRNAYIPLALTANRAGRVAGDNVAGVPSEFPGMLGSAVSKVFDLAIARTGLSMKECAELGLDVRKAVVETASRAHYYPGGSRITNVLIVENKTNKLWGVQMAGKDGVAGRINTWATAIAAGMTLNQIYDLDLAYAPPFATAWEPILIASEVAAKVKK